MPESHSITVGNTFYQLTVSSNKVDSSQINVYNSSHSLRHFM